MDKQTVEKLGKAIALVWNGGTRRIDLSAVISKKKVTIRIYQTIPGLLRVDIREEKQDKKLDAFRD